MNSLILPNSITRFLLKSILLATVASHFAIATAEQEGTAIKKNRLVSGMRILLSITKIEARASLHCLECLTAKLIETILRSKTSTAIFLQKKRH
jgi:hypothetical protein